MPMFNNFIKNVQDLVNQGVYTTDALLKKEKIKKAVNKHAGSANKWRKIVFLGVFPVLALLVAKTFMSLEEHERPPFVPYTYLRLRNKRFPWGEDGQRSLFHNKHLNPLKDGYEDEEE